MRARSARLALPARAALAALVVCLAGAAISCRTLPPDRIVQSAGEEESAALEAFALRLLYLRLHPDAAWLEALRAELERAAARPGQSRLTQARVEALRAEAALQAGDRPAARNLAEAAARLSEEVEGVWRPGRDQPHRQQRKSGQRRIPYRKDLLESSSGNWGTSPHHRLTPREGLLALAPVGAWLA